MWAGLTLVALASGGGRALGIYPIFQAVLISIGVIFERHRYLPGAGGGPRFRRTGERTIDRTSGKLPEVGDDPVTCACACGAAGERPA